MADISRLHAQAVFGLIRAALPMSVDVYLARINKPDSLITYPYLVLWPPPARRLNDSLHGWAGGATTRMQITGAGSSEDEVLAVLDRAADAVHGVTPTIAGRDCGQIRQPDDAPPPIVVDPEVKTPGDQPGRDIFVGFLFVDLHSTAA